MKNCDIDRFSFRFGGALATGLFALYQLFGTEGLLQIIRGFTEPSEGRDRAQAAGVDGPMTDLDTFRAETRAWLEANCPAEMREPIRSEADIAGAGATGRSSRTRSGTGWK